MYSTVLISPADLLEEANAFGESLGCGPNNYTVPLQAAKGAIEAGNLENKAIKETFIYSFCSDYAGHFDDVITMQGLSLV